MKLAIYGAAGMIGKAITAEALKRGHRVTALVRTPGKLPPNPQLTEKKADAADEPQVAEMVAGHDAVICAISPRNEAGPALLSKAAHALIAGLKKAGVKRLLIVGGAGSLEIGDGKVLLDSPHFPPEYKVEALAGAEALAVYRAERGLDWTFISPPAVIAPGQRTGKFRVGGDQLLSDAKGESKISVEDYAVAMLDELEKGAHLQKRITVAY